MFVRSERPCFALRNVLSPEECAALREADEVFHDKDAPPEGEDPISQFSVKDSFLSELIWSRIRAAVPRIVDGGEAVVLESCLRHAICFPRQSVNAQWISDMDVVMMTVS